MSIFVGTEGWSIPRDVAERFQPDGTARVALIAFCAAERVAPPSVGRKTYEGEVFIGN